MATALRTDYRLRDALVLQSGALAARCTRSGPGALARALGRHPSQGTRAVQGDRHSLFYRLLEAVALLQADEETTAFPLITEVRVQAMAELATWERGRLIRRWHDLRDAETTLEAEQERASYAGTLEDYEDRTIAQCDAQLEMVAISRVLRTRHRVDPRNYRADGMPLRRP